MGHSVTVSLPTGGDGFSGGEDVPTSLSVTHREKPANGLIQRLRRKLGKQTQGAEETLLRTLRPDVVVIQPARLHRGGNVGSHCPATGSALYFDRS